MGCQTWLTLQTNHSTERFGFSRGVFFTENNDRPPDLVNSIRETNGRTVRCDNGVEPPHFVFVRANNKPEAGSTCYVLCVPHPPSFPPPLLFFCTPPGPVHLDESVSRRAQERRRFRADSQPAAGSPCRRSLRRSGGPLGLGVGGWRCGGSGGGSGDGCFGCVGCSGSGGGSGDGRFGCVGCSGCSGCSSGGGRELGGSDRRIEAGTSAPAGAAAVGAVASKPWRWRWG